MTVKRAEGIIECEIEIDRSVPGKITLRPKGELYTRVRATGTTESKAATELLQKVWKIRSLKVMERAKWKCEECGRFQPLQVHHKVFRSHGRKDTMDNLCALCRSCHETKHWAKRETGS